MTRAQIFWAGVLSAATSAAWAARPFVTDDARLTTAGSCQLETWTRVYPDSRELWALPACNPTGNLELTLGGGVARNEGEPRTQDYVLQVKTLVRPLATNGWGWGLGAGTVRHPEISPGPNLLGNTYAYVPLSWSLADDDVVLHANVGWLRDRASHGDRMTWGLGGEFRLAERLQGMVELFGDDHRTPYAQVGLRYSIVPDRVQVDGSFGRPVGGPGAGRWVSVGLRFTPAKLFD